MSRQAAPAAAVVGEAMVALVLADAVLDRFGGDALAQIRRHMAATDAVMTGRLTRRRDALPIAGLAVLLVVVTALALGALFYVSRSRGSGFRWRSRSARS